MSIDKQAVKSEIGNLYRIRKSSEFPLFGKPRHERHFESYSKIERMALGDVHGFAQMIADGEIPEVFIGILSERPGAVSPMYPGVLDILFTSKIDSIRYFATWYERIHLKYHKNGR